MSVYRTQAHLDAPLDDVWAPVGNLATYPEWWPVAVNIRGEKFVDMEMGIEPAGLRYGLFDKTVGPWVIKRWTEQAVDGLRRTLA